MCKFNKTTPYLNLVICSPPPTKGRKFHEKWEEQTRVKIQQSLKLSSWSLTKRIWPAILGSTRNQSSYRWGRERDQAKFLFDQTGRLFHLMRRGCVCLPGRRRGWSYNHSWVSVKWTRSLIDHCFWDIPSEKNPVQLTSCSWKSRKYGLGFHVDGKLTTNPGEFNYGPGFLFLPKSFMGILWWEWRGRKGGRIDISTNSNKGRRLLFTVRIE